MFIEAPGIRDFDGLWGSAPRVRALLALPPGPGSELSYASCVTCRTRRSFGRVYRGRSSIRAPDRRDKIKTAARRQPFLFHWSG